ncbi:calcium-binding protein [Roseomonas sp. AR75]|uniref:calcium-binding protein n=1 Tax=Roseomonas sp. AR75 TaxID=2562311 RepID=UPI0010C061A0|nr:calcium-binding protein [Roseomonas sp. AR75]
MSNAPPEVTPVIVQGTSGNDVLDQPAGVVFMYGYAGNDLFLARSAVNGMDGNAFFYGGTGTDQVSYINSTTRVNADLAAGTVAQQWPNGTGWELDTLDSIENFRGSLLPDEILGNHVANRLWGDGGNDTIDGRDGADTVDGGNGHDSLEGGEGNDVLLGGAGNDWLKGENGNDRLEGGSGNDYIHGGGGTDTAVFNTAGSVVINLGLGSAVSDLGNDSLYSIENIVTGAGSDVLFGSTAHNRIESGGGHDYVDAGSGNDVVYSGSGADTVHGGSGHDTIHGDNATGGQGSDRLFGDAGNDVIVTGGGNNTVRGGQGADQVVLGSGQDTLRWEVGDIGLDEIHGFELGKDRIGFADAFFGANLGPGDTAEDVLLVFNAPGVGSLLMAQSASNGWTAVARFHDVSEADLEAAIANGSLFGGAGGFGGPGDVFG